MGNIVLMKKIAKTTLSVTGTIFINGLLATAQQVVRDKSREKSIEAINGVNQVVNLTKNAVNGRIIDDYDL